MSPMLDVQKRHAEVYRLRLGEKGPNGAPVKLTDSIRVTSPSKFVVDAFVDVFGGETTPWNNEGQQWQAKLPTTELPIFILPGQSITQWWEMYRGSVCERRCDSEFETLSGGPCLCPHAGDPVARAADRNACSPMTRINIICPDVEVVGAGGLVTHGIIAAETLPQSIQIAEAALARGLMVPAVLRVVEHKGKRHYVVPQVEIVGITPRALVTGEAPRDALEAGARAAIPARTNGAQQTALPPGTTDEKPPTTRAKGATKRTAATTYRPPEPDLPGDEVPPPSHGASGSVAHPPTPGTPAHVNAVIRAAAKAGVDDAGLAAMCDVASGFKSTDVASLTPDQANVVLAELKGK